MFNLIRNTFFIGCLSLLTMSSIMAQQGDAKWKKVFDGACVSTEGPAVSPSGKIYFSDITFSSSCSDEQGQLTGRIWEYDPKSGKTQIVKQNSGQSNGLYFDNSGWLVAAEGAAYGGRRISRTNINTGEYRVIVDSYKGRRLNSPNDLVLDSKNRIYFTDPRYVGHEILELPVMGVYRIDAPGKIVRIINNATRPNGIVLSPDEKTLYLAVAENGGINWLDMSPPTIDPWGQGGIVAYDLDENGNASNPRIFVDLEKKGGVDGMTVDKKGNVYAAVGVPSKPGVYVYSPKGKLLKIIDSPNKVHPTNVIIDSNNNLYLTVAGKDLWQISLK